jgi:hypothetical protein
MPTPIPPIIAYELVFKGFFSPANTQQSAMLEAIQIAAHHAGGEPLTMVYENDGLWRQRVASIFGEAEAIAVMTQIEMGDTAKLPGTYTRETLKALKFHPDYLKIA